MNRIIVFSFCILLVLIIGWHFSPIFNNFPEPSGSYGVGIISLQLKDPSRFEVHSHGKLRELVVDFYYPAEKKEQKFPYQPATIQAIKKMKAEHSLLPSFIWNNLLDNLHSYAEPYAQIAKSKTQFPVIVFSPGIGSYNLYSVYLEDLTSYGYIVAHIHPPYDTLITVFPDKRIIELDPTFKEMMNQNDRTMIYNYRAQAHAIWVKDQQFVMDCLDQLNKYDVTPLYQKIDLNKIGTMGHSHGGAVAIDVCKIEPRCKAGIDLDGWTKTANTSQGFDKPFLFLLQEHGLDDAIEKLAQNIKESKVIKIQGAGHRAFSDFIMLKWPLAKLLNVATENPEAVRKDIQAKIIAFFNKNLK